MELDIVIQIGRKNGKDRSISLQNSIRSSHKVWNGVD